MMSRPLTNVATSDGCRDLLSLQVDVATALSTALGLILSRPQSDVATFCLFFFINSWLPDLEFLSRPAHFAFNYSSVATGVLSSRP